MKKESNALGISNGTSMWRMVVRLADLAMAICWATGCLILLFVSAMTGGVEPSEFLAGCAWAAFKGLCAYIPLRIAAVALFRFQERTRGVRGSERICE